VTLELQKVLALAIDLPQDYKETGIGPERDSTGSRLGRNQKQALTNRLVKGRRGQDAARGIEPRRVDNTLNRMRRKGFGHSKKKKKKKKKKKSRDPDLPNAASCKSSHPSGTTQYYSQPIRYYS